MAIDPFALPRFGRSGSGAIVAVGYAAISKLTGLTELATLYRDVVGRGGSQASNHAGESRTGPGDAGVAAAPAVGPHAASFIDRVLDAMRVRVAATDLDLAHVPVSGPLLVAANHPRGALDGLILLSLLRTVRPDVRVVANHILARIPELHEHAFFVDPFGGPTAESRSLAGLRAAHLWLRRGGALVMFPSGEVAHRLEHGVPLESDWSTSMGRLALQSGAQVLPVALDGRNSDWFYRAGRLHPLLRTAMLGREFLRARGANVRVAIGQPMSPRACGTGQTRVAATDADTTSITQRTLDPRRTTEATRACVQAMAVTGVSHPCDDGDRLRAEIAALDASACFVSSGAFRVFCATADQIPLTLREIGRLRADTYRAAGEGTSAEYNLDRFDKAYQHLFVWDEHKRAVVGAYRLGLTDRLVASAGVGALYTRTLFDFDDRLLAQLPPAIELGRSFVRTEYQRLPQPLLLLWKGIGQFVRQHPHYRVLFGPVSVSARYCDASHGLLVSFLEQHRLDHRLTARVAPRHPFVGQRPMSGATSLDADALERTIASLEPDGKGVPVLLRHYLRLGARALGFGVDPDFGAVLDVLMMVDLAAVEPALLSRYLGRDEARAYLARHRAVASAAA